MTLEFHVKPEALIEARAAELGLRLSPAQVDRLIRFEGWLRDEALPAGAIGPHEGPRVLARHVLDSLAVCRGWEEPPASVVDVGSGAGLPGIPLAIVWPGCQVVLLERSGRRARLLRRAIRVLGLENALVEEGDVGSAPGGREAAVMRGVFPPEEAIPLLDGLLSPAGTAVVAVGPAAEPPPAPEGRRITVVDDESTVLARTARLLIMAPL